MTPDPLDGLDAIRWTDLEHAYGPARDVPDQIRALRSPDKATRAAAVWTLFGNIVHQGTRYQASSVAVPFLVDLATAPMTPDPGAILQLLYGLAIGDDDAYLPEPIPIGRIRTDVAATRGQDKTSKQWELDTYDAVRARMADLIGLVDHTDPVVRAWALALAGWFPEERPRVVAMVRARTSDPDDAVAATAAIALGLLAPDGDEAALAVVRQDAPDGSLRALASAIAEARIAGAEIRDVAIDRLIAGIGHEKADMSTFPYLDGDIGGLAGASCRLLPAAAQARAVEALGRRLATAAGFASLPFLDAILAIAFPDGPVAPTVRVGDLRPLQQAAVRAIARSPAWRVDEAQVANVALLIRAYGMPGDDARFQAWAAGEPMVLAPTAPDRPSGLRRLLDRLRISRRR